MPRLPQIALALTLLLSIALPLAGQAPCTDNPWLPGWSPKWQPLFQGIDWMGACTTYLPSQPTQPNVRTQRANGLRIDLTAPGIQFFSAPKPSGAGTSYDTHAQRASDFLCTWGLQVAVNANFFWPCCSAEPGTPPAPNQVQLCGLAVAAGQTVSELSSVPVGADAGVEALLLTGKNQAGKNQASFQTITRGALVPPGTCTAVAGSPQPLGSGFCPQTRVPGPVLLLKGGANQANSATDPTPPEKVAARTAVATSEDGRYLYLLTIDGTDGSANGAGFYDEAAWLQALGGFNGMNLDGGGSTTMAAQLTTSQVTVLNNPSEKCSERYVGTFLGVQALSLPKGTPANLSPVPGTPGIAGCGVRTCSGAPQPIPACVPAPPAKPTAAKPKPARKPKPSLTPS